MFARALQIPTMFIAGKYRSTTFFGFKALHRACGFIRHYERGRNTLYARHRPRMQVQITAAATVELSESKKARHSSSITCESGMRAISQPS
jgi:hypothetical protein